MQFAEIYTFMQIFGVFHFVILRGAVKAKACGRKNED